MKVVISLLFAGMAPLLVSTIVDRFKGAERRWIAASALFFSFIATVAAFVTYLDHPVAHVGFGFFQALVDPAVLTISPMIVWITFSLVMGASRDSLNESVMGVLCFVSGLSMIALFVGSPFVLLGIEAVASITLAVFMGRHGVRTRTLSLALSGLLFIAALLSLGTNWNLSFEEVPTQAVWLALIGGAMRLGLFPFSVGLASSHRVRVRTLGLIGTLPFGGLIVLDRIVEPAMMQGRVSHDLVTGALLLSALIGAGCAISQLSLRRSFGWMQVCVHSLICIGLMDADVSALAGVEASTPLAGELLWAGFFLTTAGFGTAIAMVERRVGPCRLDRFSGLHSSMPFLSLMFLLLGVGLAGAPGTLEFIAEDLLLNTAHVNGDIGMLVVVLTIAMLGYNVMRAYFRIFYGRSVEARAHYRMKPRERLSLVLLASVVFLGGMLPSLIPLVATAQASGLH